MQIPSFRHRFTLIAFSPVSALFVYTPTHPRTDTALLMPPPIPLTLPSKVQKGEFFRTYNYPELPVPPVNRCPALIAPAGEAAPAVVPVALALQVQDTDAHLQSKL